MKFNTYILLSPLLLLFSCQKENNFKNDTYQYLYISHIRADEEYYDVNETITEIDFSNYDLLILGGDISKAPLKKEEYTKYLDSIFDFGSKNTLWVLGNHGYWSINQNYDEKLDLYEKYTKRKSYYSYTKNGITFVVLDTQMDNTKITGNQLDMLTNITDTISKSSHLVILHHKLFWLTDNGFLQSLKATSNPPMGDCFDCLNPNNFYDDVYPLLQKVRKKGVEVVCIGGDSGLSRSKFLYKTTDNITFIANGIKGYDAFFNKNYVLVINHDAKNKTLTFDFQGLWRFQKVEDNDSIIFEQIITNVKQDSSFFSSTFKDSQKYGRTFEDQIYVEALNLLEIFNIIKNNNKLLSSFLLFSNLKDNSTKINSNNVTSINKHLLNPYVFFLRYTDNNNNILIDYTRKIDKKLTDNILEIYKIILSIQKNKNWDNRIHEKADNNYTDYKTQIITDAIWIIKNNLKNNHLVISSL